MASKIPVPVAILASLVSLLYLISAMVLLSSIIAWLSVDFSGPLPHALGFAVGVLSLLGALIGILMVGIPHLRRTFGFIFLATTVVTLFACIGLIVPFIISFASFCQDCDQEERTRECLNSCDDECCFTDVSMPLAIIFIAFTGTALFTSILGTIIAVPYIWYGGQNTGSRKQH